MTAFDDDPENISPDPYGAAPEPVTLEQVRAVLAFTSEYLDFATEPGIFDMRDLDGPSRLYLLKLEAALVKIITPAHGFDHALGASCTEPAAPAPTRTPGVPDIFRDGPEAPPRARFRLSKRIPI